MELLRLLLLDDEYIILEGLKDTYDWEKMGYRVVGAYTDAEDALLELNRTKPQVILSDIRMKNMDGLEFYRQVLEEIPDCMAIFVSAYRDFDYAKKACELGAFGYLPKPFKDHEITDLMTRAHDAYLEQKQAIRGYLVAKYLTSQKNIFFINAMVEKFAKQQIDSEGIERLLDFAIGKPANALYYTCAIVDLDIEYALHNELEYEATRFELFEKIEIVIRDHYPVWSFLQDNGSKVYIVCTSEREGHPKIQELIAEVEKQKELELLSVVSRECFGIPGILSAFRQAKQLYEIMLGYGSGGKLNADDAGLIDVGTINNRETQIIDMIRRNDAEGLKERYKQFVKDLPVDDEDARMYLLQLAIRAHLYVRETYGASEKLNASYQTFYRRLFSVSKNAGADILHNLIAQTIKARVAYCRENSANNFSSYIQQAVEYIDIHYGVETLTINDVAAAVYLNPVYFGRMFKQSMGIPFRRYLMNVRMEKAKQLLTQGKYGILEIGEMVGIENPSYFTQLFKKYTGMVPSEYANGMTDNRISEQRDKDSE